MQGNTDENTLEVAQDHSTSQMPEPQRNNKPNETVRPKSGKQKRSKGQAIGHDIKNVMEAGPLNHGKLREQKVSKKKQQRNQEKKGAALLPSHDHLDQDEEDVVIEEETVEIIGGEEIEIQTDNIVTGKSKPQDREKQTKKQHGKTSKKYEHPPQQSPQEGAYSKLRASSGNHGQGNRRYNGGQNPYFIPGFSEFVPYTYPGSSTENGAAQYMPNMSTQFMPSYSPQQYGQFGQQGYQNRCQANQQELYSFDRTHPHQQESGRKQNQRQNYPKDAHNQHGHGQHGNYRNSSDGNRSQSGTPNRPQSGTPGSAKSKHRGRNTPASENAGNRQDKRSNKKFQPYEKYWVTEDASAALKRGELILGPLRINPRNYEDAYIPHPDGISDIYICGMRDRNRALNGDIVAVQLFDRSEWKVLMDDLEASEDVLNQSFADLSLNPVISDTANGSAENAQNSNVIDATVCDTDKTDSSVTSAKTSQNDRKIHAGTDNSTPKSKMGANKNTQTPQSNKKFTTLGDLPTPERCNNAAVRRLFDSGETSKKMEAVPDKLLLRTGKVVYIIEKKHSRASTGNIKLMADKNPNCALFRPLDSRMPRLIIPMSDCPKGFMERPDDCSSTLFIARVTEWEETSQMAKGRLARSLGEAGEIEPETEGMLIENDIDYSDFSDESIACLPTNLPWSIPPSEYDYRKDLRKKCIFSIDPKTARDLDDALHCEDLGDGRFEVGVHIADVSYFVTPNNELDRVAASRATSVYLVQKVIPMLPRLLCEQLCSLNPAEDRLTFSVIWTISEDGEIESEWFGRSVIRSCVKLAYDHAQGFIEDPEREWTEEELPPITEGFPRNQIRDTVLKLNKIAVNLRKRRFESGALRLDQVKLGYELNSETGMPSGYYVYHQKDSNKLVEEFMLLANMAVAHKIYKTFPEIAILRRHPPPQTKMVEDLVSVCRSLGVDIDASSAGALQVSLAAYYGDSIDDQARVQILTVLCSKPMQNARYFCSGCIDDQTVYRHYALNVPLYTHFTSPIRRYPDIMVHRLLAAALEYTPMPSVSKGDLQKEAEHCNDKKLASKRVQDLSSELFFAIFVKECGPLEERGMVMGVLDKAFDVLILKLGVVKRVYCEKLPLADFSYHKEQKKPVLTLTWAVDDVHKTKERQQLTIFSPVECILTPDDQPLKWTAIIKHPKESSQSQAKADCSGSEPED